MEEEWIQTRKGISQVVAVDLTFSVSIWAFFGLM